MLSVESQRIGNEKGYVLSVFDAHDGLNMSPAARRYSNDMATQFSLDGSSLIIGAGLALRTVAHLLQNAARLFGKPSRPVDFGATLDEVPKWLEQQRQYWRTRHAGTKAGEA